LPSKSTKQAKLMAMAAHSKEASKRTGIPQSVAREFNKSDQKTGILKKKGKK